MWFLLFCNENHQSGFVKDSSSYCWDHFLPWLFFFPWYEHSLFVNIIFDWQHTFVFWFSFSSFPFFSWCFFLGRFWYVSWTEFQLVDDFVWGIFFKEKFILGLKRVQWKIYWLFGTKNHGHISFWVLIAWFSERLTPATTFNDSQHLSFFFFFLFIVLSFAQISLLWAYQSNRLLLRFYFWMPLKRRDWEWNYSYENFTWLPQCDVYLTLTIDTVDYWDESFLLPAGWRRLKEVFKTYAFKYVSFDKDQLIPLSLCQVLKMCQNLFYCLLSFYQ